MSFVLTYLTSDNSLDAQYAAAFDSGDAGRVAELGGEILDRLASPLSFVQGALGIKRFPLYDSRGAFHQVEVAQGSVSTQAASVASTIATYSLPLLTVAVVVYFLVVRKI